MGEVGMAAVQKQAEAELLKSAWWSWLEAGRAEAVRRAYRDWLDGASRRFSLDQVELQRIIQAPAPEPIEVLEKPLDLVGVIAVADPVEMDVKSEGRIVPVKLPPFYWDGLWRGRHRLCVV